MRPKAILREVLAHKKEIGVLAAALLIGGLAAVAYNQTALASAQRVFARTLSESIKPRELSPKHRQGATGRSCTECHAYAGAIPDSKCEHCHAEIAQRRAHRVGYHGTLTGDCIRCHKEHPAPSESIVPLDRKTFDHNLASFKREGKHAQVACDECHKKKRPPGLSGGYYVGLKHDSCTDCHRDPHRGQMRAACEKCHSPTGWKGDALKFNHEVDSTFPLVGKHQSVACLKCHNPGKRTDSLRSAVFQGLSRQCSSCHDEPHQRQFTADCSTCHSPVGWDRRHLAFDHNRDSGFPLVAQHTSVSCDQCHPRPSPGQPLGFAKFRGLGSECADCHKDPHQGQFGQTCTQCHETPVPWSAARRRIDHGRDTKFPLSGKHASVDCIQCHKPQTLGAPLASAQFRELATGCEACHQVRHPPDYGSSCTSCHTPAAWPKKNPGMEHIFNCQVSGENLEGRHLTAKCSACHDGSKIGPRESSRQSAYQCQTCHLNDEPHQGVLGTECLKCHGMDGWKGVELRFNHNRMATFSLDQDHRKLACAKCHENGHWKPLDAKCESCHTTVFLEKRK